MDDTKLHILDDIGQLLIDWDSIASKTSEKFVEYVKGQLKALDIKPIDLWSRFSEHGTGYLFFRDKSGLILQCQFLTDHASYHSAILVPDLLRKLDEMGWIYK